MVPLWSRQRPHEAAQQSVLVLQQQLGDSFTLHIRDQHHRALCGAQNDAALRKEKF